MSKLWLRARVKIEAAPDPRYEGIREVTDVWDQPTPYNSFFKYQLMPGMGYLAEGSANCRIVSGVDLPRH